MQLAQSLESNKEQVEQKRLPLSEVAIPDLSDIKAEEEIYWRKSQVESELTVGGVTYPCRLLFERLKEDELTEGVKSTTHLAKLGIEILDMHARNRIAFCNGVLLYGKKREKPIIDDGRSHAFWHIYTRFVEKEYRHKGLGSATLQAFEQTIDRIETVYSQLGGEWIEFNTYLSSLTKILISQDWLKRHHLERFAKRFGEDFGYIPQQDDEKIIEQILEAGSEGLEDVKNKNNPEVCLYKAR